MKRNSIVKASLKTQYLNRVIEIWDCVWSLFAFHMHTHMSTWACRHVYRNICIWGGILTQLNLIAKCHRLVLPTFAFILLSFFPVYKQAWIFSLFWVHYKSRSRTALIINSDTISQQTQLTKIILLKNQLSKLKSWGLWPLHIKNKHKGSWHSDKSYLFEIK